MAGQDLEINIKTRADLKGARDLEAALKAQIASLKKLGQDASGAEAQLRKVQSSIKAAPIKNGILDRTADSLRRIREQGGAAAAAINGFASLATAPLGALTAIAGSLTAAFAGAMKAIREFAESDDATVTLDAALAQNQLLTEATRQKYQELATQLQRTTTIADEVWMRTLAQLTLYGSKPESIGMDIEAVKSLAALLGGGEGGVVQAANLWSKALNGNFSWLKRYNIEIDESIPKHERLKAVQLELAERAGGQLEQRAKSVAGVFAGMLNANSDFFESLGKGLTTLGKPILVFNDLATKGATLVLDFLFGWIDSSSKLQNANKATTQTTEETAEAVDKYAMKLETAVKAIQNLQKAQDELADADLAARLAVVDSDETRGKLTKEQAIRLRFQLRQNATDNKLQNNVAANSATIRTLYGRLPGLEASGKTDEMQTIQQQIRDLDAANQQAVRLRNTGRFTESLGAADDVFRARKDAGGPNAAVNTKAGFELLGNAIEESLDKLVARVKAKTDKLEDQIRNGNR